MAAKSPFPGMDPYLEPYWPGVHTSLAVAIANDLGPRLPDDLRADVDQRFEYGEVGIGPLSRPIEPDAYVSARPHARPTAEAAAGATAVLDETGAEPASVPRIVPLDARPVRVRFVRIYTVGDRRLVTAIELLSPSNKRPGRDRDAYLRKRDEYLDGGASVVEIDLHRRGRPTWDVLDAADDADASAATGRAIYRVAVIRGWDAEHLEVYSARLQDRLPAVRVPLRQGEPDVVLRLQPLLDALYAVRRYDIDYGQPCRPPLTGDDLAWWEQRRAELRAAAAAAAAAAGDR